MHNDIEKSTLIRDEGGAGTAWWVLWMIFFLLLGGVAVDSSNAWRMRTELQATADAAAHAGIIDLPNGPTATRNAAIDFAELNMPTALHSEVLKPADVLIGTWDGSKFTQMADADVLDGDGKLQANAVLARTRRDSTNSNRLQAYFLRLIGMGGWDVSALAIAQRYFPECLQGSALVAGGKVVFKSNNDFSPGICIHAQEYVSLRNGNCWEPGVSVTMPHLSDLDAPPPQNWEGDGVCGEPAALNVGLTDALGEENFQPKAPDLVESTIEKFTDTGSTDSWPSYIGYSFNADGSPVLTTDGDPQQIGTWSDGNNPDSVFVPADSGSLIKEIDAKDWNIQTYEQGYIYDITCNQESNLLDLNSSVDYPLQNVVVIANCNLKLGTDGIVHDAVIASTAGAGGSKIKPWDNIIDIGQGTHLGLEGCSVGGPNNVQIYSTASVNGPASTTYWGVKIVAAEDVNLAAQADGIEQIVVEAGNDINLTSNNAFGDICSPELDEENSLPYYRLVY